MKIACIGDTHGEEFADIVNATSPDVFIHCGDWSTTGSKTQTRKFFKHLRNIDLPKERKIIVAGNHEIWLGDNPNPNIRTMFTKDCIYLENESYTLDGINFFGSPNVHNLPLYPFNLPSTHFLSHWDKVPDDTHVLITHTPAKGVHDEYKGELLGEEQLGRRISQLRHLKVHLCGHIHEQGGQISHHPYSTTMYLNCATKLMTFELE